MPLVPITLEKFVGKSFLRPDTYLHAIGNLLVRISAVELPYLIDKTPIGFVFVDGHYHLVAIQGISNQFKNLWVTPEGKWIGGYVPVYYRAYPFGLSETQEGIKVLCIQDDTPLLREDLEGLPFFEGDNAPTEFLTQTLRFLIGIQKEILYTDKICD